jgi:hypothetical protein
MPYVVSFLVVATVAVAVWLVKHPVALLTVNVGVAMWWRVGPVGVVVAVLLLWLVSATRELLLWLVSVMRDLRPL